MSTSRPGVYACGMALGPQDIPGSLTQASAAGCMASANLAAPRALRREDDLPKEQDFSGQEPRIGVFFVDWGRVVQEVVDPTAVEEAAAKLGGVVHVEKLELSYGQDGLSALEKAISEHQINRVVVAGYSPRTHGRIFAEAIRKAGLNRAYLEMANIREQDALVHHGDPVAATAKAITLVRTAVAGVRQAKPTPSLTLPFNPDAMVVGGGVAGMSAALGLAGQGGKVYLVERGRELGGLANELARTLDGRPVAPELAEMVQMVKANSNIEILTDTLVVDHKGQVGSFITGVQTGPGMFYRQINHGVTILATGARRYEPTEYLYGQDPKVMTQLEMEKLLASGEGGDALDTVVMIQCVGSRNDDNPTCGRICCRSAVKNALWIKEQKPDAQVFVLYRDMRMPFTSEDAYRQAREEGVLFRALQPGRASQGEQGRRHHGGDLQRSHPGPRTGRGTQRPGAVHAPDRRRRGHRGALRDLPFAAGAGRLPVGGPSQGQAHRHPGPRSVRGGFCAGSGLSGRGPHPGSGRRRPRPDHGIPDELGARYPGGQGKRRPLRRVLDMRAHLPLWYSLYQRRWLLGDRPGPVSGLRGLRRRVPGPGHPVAGLRG